MHDEEVHAWADGDPVRIREINRMTVEDYYNWKESQHERAERQMSKNR